MFIVKSTSQICVYNFTELKVLLWLVGRRVEQLKRDSFLGSFAKLRKATIS
jgi:hypothetical protein